MIGASRQTISKSLKALAASGAVEIGYGEVTIANIALLLRLADGPEARRSVTSQNMAALSQLDVIA